MKEEPFSRNPILHLKIHMRFEEIGAQWGLDHVGMSYAAAHGDLDGDGDLIWSLQTWMSPSPSMRTTRQAIVSSSNSRAPQVTPTELEP